MEQYHGVMASVPLDMPHAIVTAAFILAAGFVLGCIFR